MTREEEIYKNAIRRFPEKQGTMSALEYKILDDKRAAYIQGWKDADEHQKNPWRDAKKELPKKINKFYSDFVFVAYPVNGEFHFGLDRYDFE